MKLFSSPLAKTILTTVAVIVALNFLRPFLAKVPLVNKLPI